MLKIHNPVELKLHGRKRIENGFAGAHSYLFTLKAEKRKEAPFTWNMTGSRLVARRRTRTAWCLPGEPRRESSESIVTGEESGSKEGNVDIVPL